MNKTHWIKEIEGCAPRWATTFCGKYGADERCNEFTTVGREDRFEAFETRQGVTCKACLKAGDRAQRA